MDINVIYSDKDIAVCIKPLGLDSENEMLSALSEFFPAAQLHCVHRLDKAVSGLMVYALNRKAAASLSQQIQDKSMKKEYLAVVQGRPEEDRAVLRDLLYRDRAKNKSYVVSRKRAGVKEAELEYELLDTKEDMSLLHITLHTGRSHQIRVQFSSRKMPLVGDVKYGSQQRDCPIALWSYALSFRHPGSGESIHFERCPERALPWDKFDFILKGAKI